MNLEELRSDGGKTAVDKKEEPEGKTRQCDFQVAQKKKQLPNEYVFFCWARFSSRLTSSIPPL